MLVIFTAQYLYVLPVIYLVVALLFSHSRKPLLAISICAFPIAFISAKLLGLFIQSPRPFVLENIQPLIPHATNNGFPSNHTLYAMTIAMIIFTFNRKIGIALSFIALLVGISRVYAKVHHPADIFGGVVIAMVSVSLGWYILKMVRNRKTIA